jgi:hypothetical protein
VVLVEEGDLRRSIRRTLDVFTEAAELDRERARRWAQLNAVQSAFSGRRHGYRRARKGAELERLIALVDELAAVLIQLRRTGRKSIGPASWPSNLDMVTKPSAAHG